MALIKNEMTDYGVEANYWKVAMLSIDRVNSVGSFSLMLYKDREQSKNNPDKFFKDKVYYINREVYPYIFENMETNLYLIAYNHIKTTDDYFKDAISDNEEVQQ